MLLFSIFEAREKTRLSQRYTKIFDMIYQKKFIDRLTSLDSCSSIFVVLMSQKRVGDKVIARLLDNFNRLEAPQAGTLLDLCKCTSML